MDLIDRDGLLRPLSWRWLKARAAWTEEHEHLGIGDRPTGQAEDALGSSTARWHLKNWLSDE